MTWEFGYLESKCIEECFNLLDGLEVMNDKKEGNLGMWVFF